ncbi:MAG: GAF domain-containing protein [Candidatus Heimdallarchaeum aukensis]|uniref:GAF domain-containing protein n=1 Tax=Candidatus Heimdallarchaeum aukensis TaxID=2876573 RepID=A0A9Y1BMH2_9ARCH|nr:MAG: GAF domain-containing protein [Candidatus Heimdallarchaeum aukensis]
MEESKDYFYDIQLDKKNSLNNQMRETLQSFINSFPFYVMLIDEDHHIQLANNAILDQLKMDPTAIVGCYCPSKIHGLDSPFAGCPLEASKSSLKAIEREYYFKEEDRWVRSTAYHTNIFTPENKRLFIHLTIDITAQKNAENKLKRSEEKYRLLASKLQKLNDLHKKLNEIQEIFIYERDKTSLIHRICSKLSELISYDLCWIGILDSGKLKILASSSSDSDSGSSSSSRIKDFFTTEIDLHSDGRYSCLHKVIEQKQLIVINKDNFSCSDCLFHDTSSPNSILIFPMIVNDNVYGIISLYKSESHISENEISILQTVANALAFALQSIELIESQNEAFSQLKRNIDYLEDIIDKIRNPLTVIQGFVELYMKDKSSAAIIKEHINQIVEILSKVDEKYIRSTDLFKQYTE